MNKFKLDFHYQKITIYKCHNCGLISNEMQDRSNAISNLRTILCLPTGATAHQVLTLQDLWSNNTTQTTEPLQFNEGRECVNNCRERNVFRGTGEISGQPSMLFMQIMRFGFDNNRPHKIKTPIDIPHQFSPFPEGDQYNLHSITYHLGHTAQSGHYTTLLHFKDNQQVLISDNVMQPIPVTGPRGEPYFLIYVRGDLPNSPVKKKMKLARDPDFSGLPKVLQEILRGNKVPRPARLDRKSLDLLYKNLLHWTSFSLPDESTADIKDLQKCVNNQLIELIFTVWPGDEDKCKWLMSRMLLDKKIYNNAVVLESDWPSQEGKIILL